MAPRPTRTGQGTCSAAITVAVIPRHLVLGPCWVHARTCDHAYEPLGQISVMLLSAFMQHWA